jgi:hypothetical protein
MAPSPPHGVVHLEVVPSADDAEGEGTWSAHGTWSLSLADDAAAAAWNASAHGYGAAAAHGHSNSTARRLDQLFTPAPLYSALDLSDPDWQMQGRGLRSSAQLEPCPTHTKRPTHTEHPLTPP